MAIYSLHHSHVGKATQAQAGTAGAHVCYITRAGAASLVMAEHMPSGSDAARAWIDERETADRKNGRVIDKLLVALPVELNASQRADLVRDFMERIGGGRVSWMAGIHDRGEDARNPHAHIVLRDKDLDTGKRVFGTSEKGSTDRIRELWEMAANDALQRAGFDARIDRRSLDAQGLDREAGIHVGPNVAAMEDRGIRPASVAQELENGRVVNWPEIDQGRTRADRQREIEAGNLEGERDRQRDKSGDQSAGLAPAVEIVPEPVPPYVPNFVLVPDAPGPEIAARKAQEPVSETGVTDLPGQAPKAAQRPSHEAEATKKTPDPGRWSGIIAAARDRLAALAERLDAAFARIRDQVLKPEPGASHVSPRAPMLDLGRGGSGMTRASDSGPVNARMAAGLRPEPKPAPVVNEDRAREIQREIEAGRKAGTYDRDRMRDLAREHHELRGAAPDIAPAPERPPAAAPDPSTRPQQTGRAQERPMADDLRRLLDRYTGKNHAHEPGGRE